MRILIIRHADPDYSIDSLTPTGVEEAKALHDYLAKEKIDYVYCSPLGRARKTKEIAMEGQKGYQDEGVVEWLREFPAEVIHDTHRYSWDFLPLTIEEGGDDIYSVDRFMDAMQCLRESPNFKEKIRSIYASLDEILEKHGYKREGHHYKVVHGNTDTIAFFCHFGVESVLLSRLINASPFSLWQGSAAAPSSITTLYTEERREGLALFRMASFGDTSHLALKGMKPSFSARFSETFDDPRRHD